MVDIKTCPLTDRIFDLFKQSRRMSIIVYVTSVIKNKHTVIDHDTIRRAVLLC